MTASVKATFTVTADNPETGAQIIRAMLTEKGAAEEAARMKKTGLRNIKIAPVRDPAGNAG